MGDSQTQLTDALTKMIKDYTEPFEDQIDALRQENATLEMAKQTSEQRRVMLQKLNTAQKARYEKQIKLLRDDGEAPISNKDARVCQEIDRLSIDLGRARKKNRHDVARVLAKARKIGCRCRFLEVREVSMRLEMDSKDAEIGRLREEVRRLRQGHKSGVRTGEDRPTLVEMTTPQQQSIARTDTDTRRKEDDKHASQLKTPSTTCYFTPRPGSEKVRDQVAEVTDFVQRACEAMDTKPFTIINLKARRGLYGRFEEVREELRRAVARCRLDVASEHEFEERVRLRTLLEAAMEEQFEL